jgi:hypothetical protein
VEGREWNGVRREKNKQFLVLEKKDQDARMRLAG